MAPNPQKFLLRKKTPLYGIIMCYHVYDTELAFSLVTGLVVEALLTLFFVNSAGLSTPKNEA